MNIKKVISSICTIGMVLAQLNLYQSYAVETNRSTETSSIRIEKPGVFYDGDSYKELSFYEGELTLEGLNNRDITSLPSFVDISTDPCFPQLGNQNPLGSCVGFATTYYQFSYEVNKMNGVTSASNRVVYSPKWTYNSINEGDDLGAYMTDAFIILKNYGALKLSDLPYDSNYSWLPGNTNISSNEMIPERMEALETRISSFGSCELPNSGTFIYNPNDSDLYVIKSLLNSGKILSITTGVSFNYKWGTDHNNSQIKVNYRCYGGGGHAMAVVGYDDNVWCDVNGNGIAENCEKGAFKLANSYGANGVSNDTNGYKWVLYDALNAISANTVNTWEQNLSGTRNQALCFETDEPTFWYINVMHKDVYYVGEINIDTGTNSLSESHFNIGRSSSITTSPTYSSNDMLPTRKGAGIYKGKILFDYDYLCTPISTYYSGYDWYVNFSDLYGSYSLKAVDNLENIISDTQVSNYLINNKTKAVRINTKLGDLDYDGVVEQEDAYKILYLDAGVIEFSTLQYKIGDFNQNGSVTLSDYTAIMQYIANGGS